MKAVPLLLVPSLPLAYAACYDAFGTLQSGHQPCKPNDPVSWCCSEADYCLSNGLCLDAGANNVMTQQSCSSEDWPQPCLKYCKTHNSFDSSFDGDIAIIPCDQSWKGGNEIKYCCDPDAQSCCSSGAWQSIPVGTIIREPIDGSRTSAATTSKTSPVSTGTTTTSSPGGNASSTTPSASSGGMSDTTKLGLGLGLGLGIPIIVLALVVGYLLLRSRKGGINYNEEEPKYNTQATPVQQQMWHGRPPTELPQSVTTSELPGYYNPHEMPSA